MDKMNEQAFERAKHFFEYDYHDRGMVKWQGFYLSDHMEDVDKYTKVQADVEQSILLPNLSMQQVSAILWQAYINCQTVKVQRLAKDNLDHVRPFIFGKVHGYSAQNILIGDESLALEDINWCEILSTH